jgi:hypothetical protein
MQRFGLSVRFTLRHFKPETASTLVAPAVSRRAAILVVDYWEQKDRLPWATFRIR